MANPTPTPTPKPTFDPEAEMNSIRKAFMAELDKDAARMADIAKQIRERTILTDPLLEIRKLWAHVHELFQTHARQRELMRQTDARMQEVITRATAGTSQEKPADNQATPPDEAVAEPTEEVQQPTVVQDTTSKSAGASSGVQLPPGVVRDTTLEGGATPAPASNAGLPPGVVTDTTIQGQGAASASGVPLMPSQPAPTPATPDAQPAPKKGKK